MSWRAVLEPHLIELDTSGKVAKTTVLKTPNRATIGLNYGYDADFALGRMVPRLSNPSFSASIEGWFPGDDKGFLSRLLNAAIFALSEPVSDPNYSDALTHVATATLSDGDTIQYNAVLALDIGLNRLQITLNDSGLSFSAEYVAVDESRGRFYANNTGGTVTRKIIADEATYSPSAIDISSSFSSTVLENVYPPEVARGSGILSIYDSNGNPLNVLATSLQITLDFGAEVRYTVDKQGVILARDIPRVEVQLELVPDEFTPTEFNKLGQQLMQAAHPTDIIIADNANLGSANHAALRLTTTEYVVQTDDFEASADFGNPRITIIPLRYTLYDGNGNALFGW